jgi:hypothetical protein
MYSDLQSYYGEIVFFENEHIFLGRRCRRVHFELQNELEDTANSAFLETPTMCLFGHHLSD